MVATFDSHPGLNHFLFVTGMMYSTTCMLHDAVNMYVYMYVTCKHVAVN